MDTLSINTESLALVIPLLLIFVFLVYGWFENAKRTPETDAESKLPVFNRTIFMLWGLGFACLIGWFVYDKSFASLGFTWPATTWLTGIAWAITGLALIYFLYVIHSLKRSETTRNQVREQINQAGIDFMRPHTRKEHSRFRLLSITAGITEEIIFRGFLIAVFSLALPLPLAAFMAVIIFGLGHIYQGFAGVVRTSLLGGTLTIIYLMGGSLWPAIILHIMIDLAAGAQFQIIDKFEDEDS
jgi:membrane protease YdiL (CAAX protease family)